MLFSLQPQLCFFIVICKSNNISILLSLESPWSARAAERAVDMRLQESLYFQWKYNDFCVWHLKWTSVMTCFHYRILIIPIENQWFSMHSLTAHHRGGGGAHEPVRGLCRGSWTPPRYMKLKMLIFPLKTQWFLNVTPTILDTTGGGSGGAHDPIASLPGKPEALEA